MNKYLEKIAKQQENRPHTEAALKKLEANNGVLVHHSLGSGKTNLFLQAIERVHKKDPSAKALIIAPASLTTNIDKEIDKHGMKGINRENLEVYSYEKATNIADKLRDNKYAIAVADEAHRLRNTGSKRTRELRDILSSADKRVLATATGNYNHLADLSPLVNIVAGGKVLPEERKEMEKEFITKVPVKQTFLERVMGAPKKEETHLKTNKLGKVLAEHVHYYDSEDDPEAKKDFPELSEKVHEVEMSKEQLKYYKFAEGNIPFLTRMKIRNNLPLSKQELGNLNAFSTGVRQVSTGYSHLQEKSDEEITPKVQKAVDSIVEGHAKDKNFRGLVYSNYIDAGLSEYAKALKKKGIEHTIYDGSLTRTEKDQMVKDYNEGRTPVMLISSAGAEGLNTIGTKRVQILDPHFNRAKIQQVIGRSRRYKSHSHLPEEERKVEVEHFHSVHPKGLTGKAPVSIDQYLHRNSDDKQAVFDAVRKLMKERAT